MIIENKLDKSVSDTRVAFVQAFDGVVLKKLRIKYE